MTDSGDWRRGTRKCLIVMRDLRWRSSVWWGLSDLLCLS